LDKLPLAVFIIDFLHYICYDTNIEC
jgi:hypothetical protein